VGRNNTYQPLDLAQSAGLRWLGAFATIGHATHLSFAENTMNATSWLSCCCVAGLLAGCGYHNPSTGFDYLLNNRYAVFQVNGKPEWSLSNFVGYVMLPLQQGDDPRGRAAIDVFERNLLASGYMAVTTAEFMHSACVQQHTFLVGLSYAEEFNKGAVTVNVDLHAVAPTSLVDVVIWSWEVELDEYPLEQATFEPAVKDLFTAQPIQLNQTAPIFPPMCAPTNIVLRFRSELSRARGRVPR